MKSEALARHWRSLDDAGKVAWLARFQQIDTTLTADQLGVSIEELDHHAAAAGLVAVNVTTVDAAGMRDSEPGVQGQQFASPGRIRLFTMKRPPRRGADGLVHRGLFASRLGRHDGRLDVSRERAFAAQWEADNGTQRGPSRVEPIAKQVVPECTQRDAEVAATVIQWLGTNVGFHFLQTALANCGYKVSATSTKQAA
ncbi:hypothetical protein ABIC83_002449 [Roseateles asaccharophilus]|uniref:hypothetical protein n=1 Tax=Roseateles asaccharophilus TaxID=582607 RepID=UPI003832A9A3